MLYREYDPAVLKRLQETELEILRDFNALCEKHDIEYFAFAGTLLGAVRHGGFIPWDDDIDVGLTRENYEKFLAVAESEYPGKYKVLNMDTNPNYVCMNTHWCKCGTVFQEESTKDVDCDYGIFLDLFCFDNIPDDDRLMKKQAFKAWFWSKLRIMADVPHPVIFATGIKKRILQAVALLGYYGLKILPISTAFMYKQASKAMLQYRGDHTKRVAYLFGTKMYTCIKYKEDVFPLKKMLFEGIEISVPKETERVLCQEFGPDYMELPPVEKRHNHPPYRLSFGEENEM